MIFLQDAAQRASAAGGWLHAADVAVLSATYRRTVDQILLDLIPLAQTYAQAELSGFQVGAVAEGDSGDLFLGANLEFAGCALHETVHAEQAATVNTLMHGQQLRRLVVSAPPCGHCRQFLYELDAAPSLQVLVAGRTYQLIDLLPAAFGPEDLGKHAGLKPLDLRHAPAPDLSQAALQAAQASYAPYSDAPAGIALQARDGRVFLGPYLENAAFNPSLGPLQAALVMLTLGGSSSSDVVAAALAQRQNSKIDHLAVCRGLAGRVLPGIEVQVLI